MYKQKTKAQAPILASNNKQNKQFEKSADNGAFWPLQIAKID
jgi:hypothetical protein